MTAQQIDLYLGFYSLNFDNPAVNAEIEPGVRVGLPDEGLFVNAATPVDQLLAAAYGGYPEATATGVVCGGCTDACFRIIRHATVGHVRSCHQAQERAQADAAAELAAEAQYAVWG